MVYISTLTTRTDRHYFTDCTLTVKQLGAKIKNTASGWIVCLNG